MQTAIWIVIILLVILLIRLLRKWIKRIIFIIILFALAFLIYGIFSPSWAAKLRYNVRTFPYRISSRVSGQTFLDYDSYKISSLDDEPKELADIEPIDSDSENSTDDNTESKPESPTSNDKTIQSFSWLAPQLVDAQSSLTKSDSENVIDTGYTKSDLLWIINEYIESHLDDETDILVTVEYNGDKSDPEKIILQPYPKNNNHHWSAISLPVLKKLSNKLLRWKKSEKLNEAMPVLQVDTSLSWLDQWVENFNSQDESSTTALPASENLELEEDPTPTASNIVSVVKNHNWLSQNEQQEAEKLFSILF